jgi:p-aminobenzoyl-glutamate transporter AbgT
VSTHTDTANKSSNFKLIIGIVVALALVGGAAYGFATGVFKKDASMELPDGD